MSRAIKVGDEINLMFYVYDTPKKDLDFYVINFWDTWGDVYKGAIKGEPKKGDQIETTATIMRVDDETGYVTLSIFDSEFDVFVGDGDLDEFVGMSQQRGEERLCA